MPLASPSLHPPLTRLLRLLVIAVLVAAGIVAVPQRADAAPFSVLVFSKTAGFRHDSIPAGITAIRNLGTANGFTVDATEDATAFSDTNLAKYAAVVFLSTTGDVLDANQQAAFERYIRAGGGFAGVHAASDTEYGWAWYGSLVGAYFSSHPAEQTATVKVEDPAHPSTAHLSPTWSRFDEWYSFQSSPRTNAHVLASVDERSYAPGGSAMGADHPVAWCKPYDGGRSWYTALGHTVASYSDTAFLNHLLGGIRTAAGQAAGDCTATRPQSFQKGDAGQQHQQPDGAGRGPRRPRLLYRARRPRPGGQAEHRHHGDRGDLAGVHRQRGRPARHAPGPGVREQRLHLPVLLPHHGRGPQPTVPVHRHR
ncbi:hypothetical protein CS0771_40990 [Catellatospora sp. IY07-71]|nr:hypothetical protein CS0771_40990 [Catellatospora sp. IY07-71]